MKEKEFVEMCTAALSRHDIQCGANADLIGALEDIVMPARESLVALLNKVPKFLIPTKYRSLVEVIFANGGIHLKEVFNENRL